MARETIWLDKQVFDLAIDNIELQIKKLTKAVKVLKQQHAYHIEEE
jgi:regulator of replication initiation timing